MAVTFIDVKGEKFLSKKDHERIIREKIGEVTAKKRVALQKASEVEASFKSMQKEIEAAKKAKDEISLYQKRLAAARLGLSGDDEDELADVLNIALAKHNRANGTDVKIDEYAGLLSSGKAEVPRILAPFIRSSQQTSTEQPAEEPVKNTSRQRQQSSIASDALSAKAVKVPDKQLTGRRDHLLSEAKAGRISFREAYAAINGEHAPEATVTVEKK